MQDLSAANVLLRTFPSNPHGFTASVGDFGLARTAEELKERANPARPSCYGTVTYMAPETITRGVLAASCDVYAFGVQLWEMLTGSRAWAGLRHEQVLYYAGTGAMRLGAVEGLEGPLKELLEGTLQQNPDKR
jgi:serine/threonine protein kinase